MYRSLSNLIIKETSSRARSLKYICCRLPWRTYCLLPRTALTEEQGLFFAYLQLDEEGYKKQEVTLGADNGKSVQVLSGIKAGDRVVTQGAYQVKLASASNAIPAHSHEH